MSAFYPQRTNGPRRQRIFNAPPGTVYLCTVILVCSTVFFLAGYEGLLSRIWESGYRLIISLIGSNWELAILSHVALVPAWFLGQFGDGGTGISFTGLLPLVSHVLLHADLLHLLINLGLLMAFASVVERCYGPWSMICLFFSTAAMGGVVQAWALGAVMIPMIGASGGVYGLMGALLPALVRDRLDRRTRGLVQVIVVIMILNLLFAITNVVDLLSGLNVAWESHLAGFLAGVLLGLLFQVFPLGPRPGDHSAISR